MAGVPDGRRQDLHVLDCLYVRGKRRMVTADEAIREGNVPCVRPEHDLLADQVQ